MGDVPPTQPDANPSVAPVDAPVLATDPTVEPSVAIADPQPNVTIETAPQPDPNPTSVSPIVEPEPVPTSIEPVPEQQSSTSQSTVDMLETEDNVKTEESSDAHIFPRQVDTDALRLARHAYVNPKLIVTPVDVIADDSMEIAAPSGCAHASCQTIISSAPKLNYEESTSTIIDDPVVSEVVLVMKRYQRILRRVFDHYSINNESSVPLRILTLELFLVMVKEFSILPTLIELDELQEIFHASCRSNGSSLGFRDLVECLTRLALTIYRDNKRLPTAEQKVTHLFRAMQLDQKDIVMHRLRKVIQPTGPRPVHHDVVNLDFEQKDLDDEINKIMETFPMEGNMDGSQARRHSTPPTAVAAARQPYQSAETAISPLSAQIKSTMDAVREHTEDIARGGPINRNVNRASIGRSTSAVDDPLLRQIAPTAPLPSLSPLYYPGAAPQLTSYTRLYERKRSTENDDRWAEPSSVSPSPKGRPVKLAPVTIDEKKSANTTTDKKVQSAKKLTDKKSSGPTSNSSPKSSTVPKKGYAKQDDQVSQSKGKSTSPKSKSKTGGDKIKSQRRGQEIKG